MCSHNVWSRWLRPAQWPCKEAVAEAVPNRLPFDFDSLGEQILKGFDQPVRAFAVNVAPGKRIPDSEPDTGAENIDVRPSEVSDKPSIVVRPFTNMSSEPEQEYFNEDVITDLSKVSGLFVIARNSAFAYKDKPP